MELEEQHQKREILNTLISKYHCYKSICGLEFLPAANDSQAQRILKQINNKMLEIIKGKPYIDILTENHRNRLLYYTYLGGLSNFRYDLKQLQEYFIKIKSAVARYEKDYNHYEYINKRVHYRELTTESILKTLYKKSRLKGGRLSKNSYKRELRKLREDKPLSGHTKELVTQFLKTIKAHRNKNTLTAMQNNTNRPFTTIKYGYQTYKVILKKKANKGYYYPLVLSEFEQRVKHSYALKISETAI